MVDWTAMAYYLSNGRPGRPESLIDVLLMAHGGDLDELDALDILSRYGPESIPGIILLANPVLDLLALERVEFGVVVALAKLGRPIGEALAIASRAYN